MKFASYDSTLAKYPKIKALADRTAAAEGIADAFPTKFTCVPYQLRFLPSSHVCATMADACVHVCVNVTERFRILHQGSVGTPAWLFAAIRVLRRFSGCFPNYLGGFCGYFEHIWRRCLGLGWESWDSCLEVLGIVFAGSKNEQAAY